MDKTYWTHWVLGLAGAVIWFWGDKLGIPADAVKYAAVVVPAIVGHALAYSPGEAVASPNAPAPTAGAPSQPQ